MVADAILLLIGIVGVRRAEDVAHIVVVGGALVGIADNEAYGTSRRLSLEHSAEQLHTVSL